MILLLAMPAFAELPWGCPTITVPADARAYVEAEDSLQVTALRALAMAYWDDDCAWIETVTEGTFGDVTVERVCEGADARVVYEEFEGDGSDSAWSLSVDVPVGETWTSIVVRESDSAWGASSETYGADHERAATWAGSIEGLPDDGWFAVETTWGTSGTGETSSTSVETPDCDWQLGYEYEVTWSEVDTVVTPTQRVEVTTRWEPFCTDDVVFASIDRVLVGAVDEDTWELLPSDLDGDGVAAEVGDCDETDPTFNCLASEVPNDGLDQNCDGTDYVTWDLDGDRYDAIEFGGDDCDDGSRSVHPGARETWNDGIDQDCDGVDEIDADEDGFPLDGDGYGPADCDDTDPSVYPGATERPYDGIDQDCFGGDITDADRDGYDSSDAGGDDCDDRDSDVHPGAIDTLCSGFDEDCDGFDDCPPPSDTGEPVGDAEEEPALEDEGCAGGAAWLLALPLVNTLRRRRTRS